MKTPISYYGGKQAIVSHLLAMVPDHDVYTEVFFGGGTLFWAKKPAKNETINDKLDVVVNFYRVLVSDFDALKALVDCSLFARADYLEAQRLLRDWSRHTARNGRPWTREKMVKLAWAFWFKINTSHSNKIDGGFKYSNSMSVSPPQTFTNRKANFLPALKARIENAFIENANAIKVLKQRNVTKAFHYQDPPYMGADQGHYAGYTEAEFEELLHWNATECKGLFLLSNYNSPLLDRYIRENGWHKREITHRIAAPRKSGNAKVEVLVSNYASPCRTMGLFDSNGSIVPQPETRNQKPETRN